MNIKQIMNQAQAMQKKIEDAKNKINSREYVGEVSGGLVKIIMTGEGTLIKCLIDDSAFADKELLEDLIVVACNNAKDNVEKDLKDSMDGALGGMNLPAGFKIPV